VERHSVTREDFVRLLDFKDLKLQKGIPYTRRHLQRKVAAGEFPRPVSLSTHRIAWVEQEIDQWLADRLTARVPVDPARAKWRPRRDAGSSSVTELSAALR
jgi:prophage regulatory protein